MLHFYALQSLESVTLWIHSCVVKSLMCYKDPRHTDFAFHAIGGSSA